MSLAEIPQLEKLSTEQKLQLVEELWDSIAESAERSPVSNAERELLDSRWAAHERSPDTALSKDEFKARLTDKL